jgi:hypothetical protein
MTPGFEWVAVVVGAALVAGANRLAGSFGGRGRVAFAFASALLVGALVSVEHWPLAIWAGVAAFLWRSLPTRWVWDLTHWERYATGPAWHAAALGSGVLFAAGFVLLLPFGLIGAAAGSAVATAGWLVGAWAYRRFGLSRGWDAASEVNPAEWIAGAHWAAGLIIASAAGGLLT